MLAVHTQSPVPDRRFGVLACPLQHADSARLVGLWQQGVLERDDQWPADLLRWRFVVRRKAGSGFVWTSAGPAVIDLLRGVSPGQSAALSGDSFERRILQRFFDGILRHGTAGLIRLLAEGAGPERAALKFECPVMPGFRPDEVMGALLPFSPHETVSGPAHAVRLIGMRPRLKIQPPVSVVQFTAC